LKFHSNPGEIIGVCSEIHATHIKTMRAEHRISEVEAGGT
jgi:hypothetical protein